MPVGGGDIGLGWLGPLVGPVVGPPADGDGVAELLSSGEGEGVGAGLGLNLILGFGEGEAVTETGSAWH
jgi:hypothetical protein